jgi:hypothetical protein
MDVNRIAVAIAHAEGYYDNGSIPQRANNPGDLELGDIGYGTIEGKTIFQNAILGWQQLYKQIGFMLSGTDPLWPPTMTLAEAGLKYSGGDPNWSKNVAAALGVPETITLAELDSVSENLSWPNS